MTPAEELARQIKPRPNVRPPARVTKLRLVRLAVGLKQKDVAAALGMTSSRLCEIEKAKQVFVSTALTLARFYGKTVEELFGEDHSTERPA